MDVQKLCKDCFFVVRGVTRQSMGNLDDHHAMGWVRLANNILVTYQTVAFIFEVL